MKIFLYIRLSSADDDLRYKTESESISHQRDLLRQFVASRKEFDGAEIEEFIDDGYTGTNDDRPSFERMINRLKDGQVATVICKDFSRFFRDYTEIGDYLERIFPFLGVRFISVNDRYDSDDYKGTTAGMEVVMKYIIYSWYSKDLSQKIKTSINTRKRKGEFVSSYAPYGYMKDPENKNHLVPDPESALVVRRIFDMALDGKTTGDIARQLNEEEVDCPSKYFKRKFPDCRKFSQTSPEAQWGYYSVSQILQRLDYTGATVAQTRLWKGIENQKTTVRNKKDWIIVPGQHEAIVSEEEFNKVQERFNTNQRKEKQKRDYPLHSLVRCGVCKRAMDRQKRAKKNTTFYQCVKSRWSKDSNCPLEERFNEHEIETAVFNSLRQLLELLVDRADAVEEAARKTKGSCENLRFNLQQIEKGIKQNNLARVEGYEKYSEGSMSREDFLRLKDQLAAEQSKLNDQKAEIESKLAAGESIGDSELTVMGNKAREFLKAEEVTNQMLLNFIEYIDVYSGMRIEIKYRFSDELMKELSTDL